MYPPAVNYEIYKVEHGIALTSAQRQAADERSGRVAATLGGQWQAAVRALTLTRRLVRWRKPGPQGNVRSRDAREPVPTGPLRSVGNNIVVMRARKIPK
jgi:hypothetical protein